MSLTVMPSPWFVGLDDNGDPVAAGLLYTYEAGTSTNKATYQDSAGAVANANPVVLDAAGRAVVYLGSGGYKFVLKTAAGALVESQDNILAYQDTATSPVELDGTVGEEVDAGDLVRLSDGTGGENAGQWYLGVATDGAASLVEVGFVTDSLASGASGTIRLRGVVSGLSSLVTGTTYYVHATTPGALSDTPSVRRVGVALSTTTLLAAPNGFEVPLGVGSGGLGADMTASGAGEVPYSTAADTYGPLAAGTLGQLFVCGGAAAPVWTTPGALTKTDDTNVTLTLGGDPTTALVEAASLTLGWTGTLAPARGGLGLSSIAAFATLYASAADTYATLAPNITTTEKFLRMAGTGSAGTAPTWEEVTQGNVGLGNVENTALSTWTGSANLATVGTITSGLWQNDSGPCQLLAANQTLELGDPGSSNTPALDFHSSGNNIDYDARIAGEGGSGTVGRGNLDIDATIVSLTAAALGTGAVVGRRLAIGRNTSGNGAASTLRHEVRGGTPVYLWADDAGLYRLHTAAPTEDNSTVAHTAGTVIGDQSSSLDTKHVIGRFTDAPAALAEILRTPLYRFIYRNGRYGHQEFVGLITDEAPIFGKDRDAAHPQGKALNEITLHGYQMAAIKALAHQLTGLAGRVAQLEG